jgi:hypothetical protein
VGFIEEKGERKRRPGSSMGADDFYSMNAIDVSVSMEESGEGETDALKLHNAEGDERSRVARGCAIAGGS